MKPIRTRTTLLVVGAAVVLAEAGYGSLFLVVIYGYVGLNMYRGQRAQQIAYQAVTATHAMLHEWQQMRDALDAVLAACAPALLPPSDIRHIESLRQTALEREAS